jgi:hypothetical protein
MPFRLATPAARSSFRSGARLAAVRFTRAVRAWSAMLGARWPVWRRVGIAAVCQPAPLPAGSGCRVGSSPLRCPVASPRRPPVCRHSRASTRRTRVPHHFPRPVAVGMPCRFSSAAIPSNVVTPLACISLMVPASSLARASARAVRTARGAGGFKFTLADSHVGYRQKSLNRFGARRLDRGAYDRLVAEPATDNKGVAAFVGSSSSNLAARRHRLSRTSCKPFAARMTTGSDRPAGGQFRITRY